MTIAPEKPLSSLETPSVAGARIPSLDGVRGIAILLVMFYHMTILPTDRPFDAFWYRLTSVGWCGVTFFFVLSGFLITGILFDAKQDRHYFRNFYARRFLRIFPLYYAVVFFSLVILTHVHHPKAEHFGRVHGEEWWYWAYLSNFLIAKHAQFRHGILDVSWSLAIEEQFYLVWPIVVLLLNRRTLMWVCGVLIIVALVSRCAMTLKDVDPIRNYVLTSSHLDALAIGAWLALRVRGPSGVHRWVNVSGVLVVVALVAAIVLPALGWTSEYTQNPWMISVAPTLLALVGGALIILGLHGAFISRSLANPMLRMFGKYSYALYLFHLPIRAMVRDWFYGPQKFAQIFGTALPGQMAFYAISILLTLIAAWLSWNLFEKRMLSFKRYFESTHRRAEVITAAAS